MSTSRGTQGGKCHPGADNRRPPWTDMERGGGWGAVCGRCAGGVRWTVCGRCAVSSPARAGGGEMSRTERLPAALTPVAVGGLPGGRRGGRVGSESLGRALKGTCALSGPARAIPGAATVVTPRGSRRCHSGAAPTTGSSHRDRFRKYYPKFSIDAARVTMRSFINPKT